jgi:hypothetical protein
MSWALKSLLRRAISVLLFELVEHPVIPVLAIVVGRVLTA